MYVLEQAAQRPSRMCLAQRKLELTRGANSDYTPTCQGQGNSAEEALGAMHVQAVPLKQQVQLGLGEVVWRIKEVEAQVVAPQAALDDWEAPAVHII